MSDPDGALRQAVADVLRIATHASEQWAGAREDAKRERSAPVRNYAEGLVDGMEEAQKHLLAPLMAWGEAHGDLLTEASA